MIHFETIHCNHRGIALEASLLRPAAQPSRGTVLMLPGATGPGPSFEKAMAELAAEGYLVAGVGMYEAGADISTPQASGAHFAALMAAPDLLRERVVTWFETIRALPGVDPARIAAIGYCFGGKCVLELARSGAAIATVTSFHGLLTTHAPARPGEVTARIAVWTGGRDPYAPVADLDALREEFDSAGADYQVTLFSRAQHSFTDPDHDGFAEGIAYDETAHRIAWSGTLTLLSQSIGK